MRLETGLLPCTIMHPYLCDWLDALTFSSLVWGVSSVLNLLVP